MTRPTYSFVGSSEQARKRLLVVSFVFPPHTAIGGRRWSELSRILADRGWGLDVLCSGNGLEDYSLGADEHQLERVSPGVCILQIPWAPHSSHALRLGLAGSIRALRGISRRPGRPTASGSGGSGRGEHQVIHRSRVQPFSPRPADLRRAFLAWVDLTQEMPWAKAAAQVGREILDRQIHRAIITSGPPHVAHETGRLLSEESGIPLVMDFRDAFSTRSVLKEGIASPLWLKVAKRRESAAVSRASLVLASTPAMTEDLQELYPHAADRMACMMNGYDDLYPRVERRDRFVIAYAGSLYLDRNPTVLLQAAGRLIRERKLGPDEFEISLVGNVEYVGSTPTREIAREAGADRHLRLGGWLSRDAVKDLLARSSLNVALAWAHADAIPAKIFEYMTYPTSILLFARAGSAPRRAFQESRMSLVEPDDVEGAYQVIRDCHDAFLRGERPLPAAEPRFSRRHQAKPLLEWLDGLELPSDAESRVSIEELAPTS